MDTYTVTLPDGRTITKRLPKGASEAQVRAAFAEAMSGEGYNVADAQVLDAPADRPSARQQSNEDYWRDRLGDQGSISQRDMSLGETIADGIGGLLGGDRAAYRRADRAFSFVNDITPVGNATGMDEGGDMFTGGISKGDLGAAALGAGIFALSAAPLPGAVRTVGRKAIDGVDNAFAGMMRDESGAIRKFGDLPEGPRNAARQLSSMKGGPPGTGSSAGVMRRSEDYLRQVEQGAPGADWYEQSGRSIMRHFGGNEPDAVRFAGGVGVTSSGTPVVPNLEYAIKGHHQYIQGNPVATGRFPTQMGKDIEKIYSSPDMSIDDLMASTGEAYGPKRTPFMQQNLAYEAGDLSTARSVHDIWDARARGYEGPNGKPFSGTFSTTGHRWADLQDNEYLIPEANRRAIAGRTDWDTGRLQASAWVGNKIDSLMAKGKSYDEAVQEAITDYSHGWDQTYALHSWESAPGGNTGHLAGFDEMPWEQRLQYHEAQQNAFQNMDGQSKIALGLGMPSGGSFDNVGVYKGITSPGTQDLIPVGREAGTQAIDASSAQSMDALAATHGLLGGQEAAAWNYLSPASVSATKATGFQVNLGRGMTVEDVDTVGKRIQDVYGESVGLLPDKNGYRIVQFWDEGGPPLKDFVSDLRKGDLAGASVRPTQASTNYIENNWAGAGRYGAEYVEKITGLNMPDFGRKFDEFAPDIAEKLLKVDEGEIVKHLQQGADITLLRKTIVDKGWNGVLGLVNSGKLRAAAIPLLVGLSGMSLMKGQTNVGSEEDTAPYGGRSAA